jgi:L-cysteine:1D-myo-inositol 2-amino-2-deoxy-alpha-D-glucopyranoside ligase
MQLYNSLTQKKEPLIPQKSKAITMYVCGITPYDTTHLGHAFTYIIFDVLQRYLTSQGYTVRYTQNITDVDDDLLKKATAVKKNWQTLGELWTKKFVNDLHDLNILLPTYYVKATDSIPMMIEIIQKLVRENYAYENGGNIYFRISKYPSYGQLSRYSHTEMIKLSKERGANPKDPLKEDPLDFILWQKSKKGEPSWRSPSIGKSKLPPGRPGWHIECSAMIAEYLGEQIDIHGGGIDLLYPHHESEIAQSQSFSGKKPFVKYWMHTGAVGYQGKKMSKSLGNLIMVSDLLKKYSANALRYVLLSHHYRQSWEFDETELVKAEEKIEIITTALNHTLTKRYGERAESTNFIDAMENDLDTPKTLTMIDKFAKKTIKSATFENQKMLREMCTVLGFVFS